MIIQAVDLFCGAGGLTYGLNNVGIRVTHGIDIDSACKFPIEYNNKNTTFVERSITDITGKEISSFFKKDTIRLIAGCAPCQPFSKYSSSTKKDKNDQKWALLSEFGRIVNDVKPELVTMENVPQLRDHNVFKEFVNTLKNTGYNLWYDVVNCSDYGLPQNRRRLILVGSLLSNIELIPITHTKDRRNTVYKAIGKLPPIEAGVKNEKDILHSSPSLSKINMQRIRSSTPGGTWKDWPKELLAKCHQKNSGATYISVYGRMEWNSTSPTITTQCYGYGNGRFGHPEQNRAITLREAAILQSFPKKYRFIDKKTPFSFRKLGTMIGNAVPVTIGEIIGRSFIRHIESLNIPD
ncbi:DNA cytosine methyltransferase [Affinibrenneria salicis]|uniref:DNA (cytosine-5-)-methyltransferase n=1 Tax=Affinibrenneria salicis TaxID=2590031 RepID=A0A5J5FV58_9GAMM|nr:DNA cytosine methyltransferase [Affinibrenneria salicis]KAA8997652.1 DNA cytosine methyltransferase [Affinibrenneria salicis]